MGRGRLRGSSSVVGMKEAWPSAAAAKTITMVVQEITGVDLGTMQDLSRKCPKHKALMTAEEGEVGPQGPTEGPEG